MKLRYLVFTRGGSGFAFFRGGFDTAEAAQLCLLETYQRGWIETREVES